MIKAAEKALITKQRALIAKRNAKATVSRCERLESREEGTSCPKGKIQSTQEWGAAFLSDEELDINAQRAALAHHAARAAAKEKKCSK